MTEVWYHWANIRYARACCLDINRTVCFYSKEKIQIFENCMVANDFVVGVGAS